jgi:hypothetical protein
MAGKAELTLAFSFVHQQKPRRGWNAERRLRAFGGLLAAILQQLMALPVNASA